MDNLTRARLLNTQLNDRTLWFDGDSSFDPKKLLRLIQHYAVKYVDHTDDSIIEYNQNVPREKELIVKTECRQILKDWTIPQNVQGLDLEQFLLQAHDIVMAGCASDELKKRERRLVAELIKYQDMGLYPVLRTIIWIINKLEANDVVWGVGRGSSVSSYVLHIIGVHDVDSFAFDLNIDDFLHE